MKRLTVLKFGWEFPPNSFGGLGVACENIVKSLIANKAKIILVLPHYHKSRIKNCKIKSADKFFKKKVIDSTLIPYQSDENYEEFYLNIDSKEQKLYGNNLFEEVDRYTKASINIVKSEKFDIIHAHDWMSSKAGIIAKKISGKPFVMHIHATEFDRTGGHKVNQIIFDLEFMGMQKADKIITPSEFTKQKIIKHYGAEPKKIEVVHNAIDHNQIWKLKKQKTLDPIVLFLGRITLQKGPEYFLKVAQKVLQIRKDVTFVMAGTGDMQNQIIEESAKLGICENVLFTGHLNCDQAKKIYNMASIFVMPSISEPFGLTALEAIKCGVPTIISKQSGVSEVLKNCFKVDFWDIDQMANIILTILEHKELSKVLVDNANKEIKNLNWDNAINKILNIYKSLNCF